MDNRRISLLRPESDETLMSFLRRAQLDAEYTDDKLQLLVASAFLPDARMAERRPLDWHSVSRFFNASPEELFAMSERSLYYRMDDEKRMGFFRQRVPWTLEGGYAAHCPCCLKESPHWRKSWIGPGALVCEKHGLVMVRHCHGCGGDLSRMTWSNASPICPTCGSHFSLSPSVRAPEALTRRATDICDRFSAFTLRKPVGRSDYELARFGAAWRAMRLMCDSANGLMPLCDTILSLDGVETLSLDSSVESKALLHLRAAVAAHLINELEPTFAEHYWLSTTDATMLLGADRVVQFKLLELARCLGVSLKSLPVVGQLTMSLASWDGSNDMPKAA